MRFKPDLIYADTCLTQDRPEESSSMSFKSAAGVDVSDSDVEGSAMAAPLLRQNACAFFSSSCEQLETSANLTRKVLLLYFTRCNLH